MDSGPSTSTPIGDRIQALLNEIGESPAWLAEKVGVSRSTITRGISGDRNPTPETLACIAPVLGVTLSQLVAGTNAAARVEEAQKLVARSDYDAAVREVVAYERRANDLERRVSDLVEEVEREKKKRSALSEQLERARDERDRALHEARNSEEDARRYREGLEKAVVDVATLQQQVRTLGATTVVGVGLAGVAAIVGVANYLNSSGGAQAADAGDGTPPVPSQDSTSTADENERNES